MIWTVGIDPDTNATGLAVLLDGKVKRVASVKADRKKPVKDRLIEIAEGMPKFLPWMVGENLSGVHVAVEWQAIRPTDRRPNDILSLAVVIGSALVCCRDAESVHCPLPVQWKGSVNKKLHHKMILAEQGISDLSKLGISRADSSHVIDAIGLASWLYGKLKQKAAVADFLEDHGL